LVENLGQSELFDSMYAKDNDAKLLHTNPDIENLTLVYKDAFLLHCHKVFHFGIKTRAERKAEV